MPTILLLESIHAEAAAELAAHVQTLQAEDAADALRIAQAERVVAVLTRGRGVVSQALIDACPALRVVARVGVGLDNVDVEAATARGVPVVNAPGSTTVAVAEQTLLLMLAHARRLVALAAAVRGGRWEARRSYSGAELFERSLGVVGLGDIGRRVADLASAFGMDVAYWSRTPREAPYSLRPLDALLAESDVVSVHVALTPETRGFIGREALARMKPGALLVNTARGAVVDQGAVLEALERGHLGGYATDVWDPEPPPEGDPLLHHERVLAVPHVAAMTEATFRRMSLRTARNVLAILSGEPPEEGCVYNAARLP